MKCKVRLLIVIALILVDMTPVSNALIIRSAIDQSLEPSISVLFPAQTGNRKGLVIDPDFTVYGRSGSPSFGTLKRDEFSIVGTNAYYQFQRWDWTRLGAWTQAVHQTGFITLVNLQGDRHSFSTIIEMARQVAGMKVDIIALDEPLSIYHPSEQQLQSALNSILQVNPRQQILMNEWNSTLIRNAYAWTAKYPNVRIATDQYDDKSVIDLGISQASQYGKKSVVWLIFTRGSSNFDCYLHLDQWLAYVRGKHADVLFWYVDSSGTWLSLWRKVAAFYTIGYNDHTRLLARIFLVSEAHSSKLIVRKSIASDTHSLERDETQIVPEKEEYSTINRSFHQILV